jgi:uncharacterized membrane protein
MEGGSMNSLLTIAGTSAVLGSALMAGAFFAFSSFIMKALARIPSPEGIATMQSINVVVINPSFMGVFFGTAVLSVVVIVMGLLNTGHPSTTFFIGGAVLYLTGTFLVTIFANVPLNDQLAAVSATNFDSTNVWSRYLHRWTWWNHVRTLSAIGSVLLFTTGLIQMGVSSS